MSSNVSAGKFRNASNLSIELKPPQPFAPGSGNQNKAFGGRLTVLHGEQQKSSEVDTASRHWTLSSQGFPPGVTVDELKNYRRRRQINGKPKDNLQTEDGSLKSYKSEYKRRFTAYDQSDTDFFSKSIKDSSRKSEFNLDVKEDFPSGEYKESCKNFPLERQILKRPQSNLYIAKEEPMESLTEKNSQYIQFVNPERQKLLRRSTALKLEGEMMSETEVRSQFREYEHPEKVLPIRRSPSLKLEGDFTTLTSEQREKFISHFLRERPALGKKNTLLKMEGDFDFLTEKQVNYVHYDNNEKIYPRKRSTSLKLDGEVEFFPEYKSSYIDFPRSRPVVYKPIGNLKNEGEIESQTEMKTKFIGFSELSIPQPVRPSNNLQIEGGLEINPEYKENFVNFPRSRPSINRLENHLRQEGDIEMKTETNEELSRILEAEVKRPLTMRRPTNLKLEGDLDFTTEKCEQFKGHEISNRSLPVKRSGNLLLEGEFNFKTEKEEKFVANPIPERSDFGKKLPFLQSGREFFSIYDGGKTVTPNLSRLSEEREARSKVMPFKTMHFTLDGELMENCKRRSSRRNSKRLKENYLDDNVPYQVPPFLNVSEKLPIAKEENLKFGNTPKKSPEFTTKYSLPSDRRSPTRDNLRLDNCEYSYYKPRDRKSFGSVTDGQPFEVFDKKDLPFRKKLDDENVSDDTSESSSVNNRQPSFRLEVYNVDGNPQGFHKKSQRVFPPEGISSDVINFESGSCLGKQKKDFSKSVSSPDVPNSMLDKNNNVRDNIWNFPCENAVKVLDDVAGSIRPSTVRCDDEKGRSFKTRDTEECSRRGWLAA